MTTTDVETAMAQLRSARAQLFMRSQHRAALLKRRQLKLLAEANARIAEAREQLRQARERVRTALLEVEET